ERVAFLRRDERWIAKRAERLQGVALAYLRELGAAADLQRLDDQLDFANAAGAEFDVAAALLADGHLLIDLALDASHFFQRFEVKGPVVNEGIRHFYKSLSQRAVAGDGPGFQERQSLPRLAARLVVTFEAVERVGDIARLAFRAQPQIDAVDVAFARELAQSHGDLLAKPAKIFRGRNRRGLF